MELLSWPDGILLPLEWVFIFFLAAIGVNTFDTAVLLHALLTFSHHVDLFHFTLVFTLGLLRLSNVICQVLLRTHRLFSLLFAAFISIFVLHHAFNSS